MLILPTGSVSFKERTHDHPRIARSPASSPSARACCSPPPAPTPRPTARPISPDPESRLRMRSLLASSHPTAACCAMSSDSAPYRALLRARPGSGPDRPGAGCTALRARPELLGLVGIAGVLNLWGLSINGWANTYYSAAVRSMTTSWHDFLFASLDKTGLMTVDKPPLALWVQALSARVFGFHPLSILVPQALMGVAAAGADLRPDPPALRPRRPASRPASRWPRRRSPWPCRATTTPTSCSCCAAWPRCGSPCARSKTGRTRWLVLARGLRRPRLRDQDGRWR